MSSTVEAPSQPSMMPKPGTPARLAHLYREHVVKQDREARFLIALSYLISFGVVRFITHSIKDQRFKFLFHNVSSGGGLHLHHLVFGILGLLAVGYLSAGFHPRKPWMQRTLAILFGLSAALTLDEFALWLRLQDVYWSPEGRESVDALLVMTAIVTVAATGRGLFTAMAHDAATIVRDLLGGLR